MLSNGWTGGQYSLFRIVFGTYLCVHFARLIPRVAELFSGRDMPPASAGPLLRLSPNVLALSDAPAVVTALLVAGVVLSLPFAAGWHDRPAAVLLWYVWACLFCRNPLGHNPGMLFVSWMLLAHACLPPAPYLSWAARGRSDPGGDWAMPPAVYTAAWVLLALGYCYSGYTKLVRLSGVDGSALARPLPLLLSLPAGLLRLVTWGALALELAFAPLALVPRLRPWVWGTMLLMQVALMTLPDGIDLSPGLVLLHLFTFDPAWVPPAGGPTETVFYDGHCGLCHLSLRLILAEDRTGAAFRFAPLDSDAFRAAVPAARRAELPDSVVVQTADGRLLVRSAAVVHILRRLGGVWRLLAGFARLVPAGLRDRAYDGLASVRKRLFPAPEGACPLLPPHLRKRFIS